MSSGNPKYSGFHWFGTTPKVFQERPSLAVSAENRPTAIGVLEIGRCWDPFRAFLPQSSAGNGEGRRSHGLTSSVADERGGGWPFGAANVASLSASPSLSAGVSWSTPFHQGVDVFAWTEDIRSKEKKGKVLHGPGTFCLDEHVFTISVDAPAKPKSKKKPKTLLSCTSRAMARRQTAFRKMGNKKT